MKIFLLMMMLLLMLTFAQAQTMYCRQYHLTDLDTIVVFEEPVCYTSPVTIKFKSGNLTITTDSLSLQLVLIHRQQQMYADDENRYLGSVIGQPDQIYSIVKRTDKRGRYFLTCKPIRLNRKFSRIEGMALEISNVNICE